MITLTSDFGLKDAYVAEMKGAILSINPKTTIVDISHDIEKFNIRMAAFILASATPYFPKGTVHLAVIDPEVGTKRRAILIQTTRGFFVGPDNGLLILAAQSQGIEHVYELTNPEFMLPGISNTFHGRDIFAPAAAYLENGAKPVDFGLEIFNPVKPEFIQATQEGNSVIGVIMHIDGFGNIITNISGSKILQKGIKEINIELPQISIKAKLAKTFAQAQSQELITLVGSHGFMEIALNQSNAAERLHAKPGDKVIFMTT